MSHTFDEVFQNSLAYFNGDELAANVFASKYSLPDGKGGLTELTPAGMHKRLATEFARIEQKYDNPMSEQEIFELFSNWDVVPQGSPLSAIGNDVQIQSLSNCFVIDSPLDSYGGILHTDQEQVQIMKRRGGVGFDISNIRPKGLTTANAARTTDGIAVFMDRFSNSCREVAQGGRRGALMLTISCNHPEIETFISIKRDRKRVTGANISIRWTDEFMQAVESDSSYTLRWPVEASPEEAEVTKVVSAREVWEQFVDAAWDCAEPGALFWDTIRSQSPADIYEEEGYKTVSTNPCGEIVLSPYDSCRLMVININNFVTDPFGPGAQFDFERFSSVARKAQRLMDDLIDLEIEAVDRIIEKVKSDPEPEQVKKIEIELWNKIKQATTGGRRTGLGVTGLGDALAAMGIIYGSEESISETEKIYKALATAAHTSSIQMAAERGSFPVYNAEKEKDHPYLQRIFSHLDEDALDTLRQHGRRNISLTTTAPVGSVSCLTQTTSGIEPAYLLSYSRRKKIVESDSDTVADFVDELGDRWQTFTVYHHGVKKWMEITGEEDIEKSPYFGATSPEIDWINSVKIQAAAQSFIDHSISKTCNLPRDVSKETVSEVYLEAWKSGCKGFTVYREGSRDGVLISTEEKEEQNEQSASREMLKFATHSAPKRPEELPCEIHHATIKGEKWTILVGLMDGRPYEVLGGLAEFVEIPKKYETGLIKKKQYKTRNSRYDLVLGEGDDQFIVKDIVKVFDNPNYAGFTRVTSLALRHGAPIQYVVEQLQKDRDADLFSFARVLARTLKRFIEDGATPGGGKSCPSCGAEALTYQEGCVTCSSCGFSKCG